MIVDFTLAPEAVAFARLESKPRVLERLAGLFGAAYGLDEGSVLEHLEAREALGSTGFGRGVAIPHCRHRSAPGPTLAVLRLQPPLEFAAVDALPVSLVFGLVSPADAGATHLHALAAISRLTRDEAALQHLNDAPRAEVLFALLARQLLSDAV